MLVDFGAAPEFSPQRLDEDQKLRGLMTDNYWLPITISYTKTWR